jgi:RNA polymerase sigma-70 factor (ECF subfamily)
LGPAPEANGSYPKRPTGASIAPRTAAAIQRTAALRPWMNLRGVAGNPRKEPMVFSVAPRSWVAAPAVAFRRPFVVRDGVALNGVDPLVQRAQAGDERALSEIFRRDRDLVRRVVFRLLGPDADLEDVVQDTFIHVFRSIGSFKGEAKFSTWLYRLSANVVRMHLRRKRSRPRVVTDQVPETASADAPGQEAPDDAAARLQRARTLYEHLDSISDKKRTVLVLHDLEGVSAEEIAAIVGAPVLTVRTRLFYARRELAEALAATTTFARRDSDADLPPNGRTDEQPT